MGLKICECSFLSLCYYFQNCTEENEDKLWVLSLSSPPKYYITIMNIIKPK